MTGNGTTITNMHREVVAKVLGSLPPREPLLPEVCTCVGMCVDTCADRLQHLQCVCMDMCANRHVFGHACRHVCRHVVAVALVLLLQRELTPP